MLTAPLNQVKLGTKAEIAEQENQVFATRCVNLCVIQLLR